MNNDSGGGGGSSGGGVDAFVWVVTTMVVSQLCEATGFHALQYSMLKS